MRFSDPKRIYFSIEISETLIDLRFSFIFDGGMLICAHYLSPLDWNSMVTGCWSDLKRRGIRELKVKNERRAKTID